MIIKIIFLVAVFILALISIFICVFQFSVASNIGWHLGESYRIRQKQKKNKELQEIEKQGLPVIKFENEEKQWKIDLTSEEMRCMKKNDFELDYH